jgi:hypothetical protein
VKRSGFGGIRTDITPKSEFYIRSGTTTQLLNTKETVSYIKQHRYLSSQARAGFQKFWHI